MQEELKDSGTVTAMSVVGFVFGLVGMLGAFIPCIGSLAFYIGIPAAIISGIALSIAYSQKAKRTFAIVALTISSIGIVISALQYYSIMSAGEHARRKLSEMSEGNKEANQRTAPTVSAPAEMTKNKDSQASLPQKSSSESHKYEQTFTLTKDTDTSTVSVPDRSTVLFYADNEFYIVERAGSNPDGTLILNKIKMPSGESKRYFELGGTVIVSGIHENTKLRVAY